MPCHRSSLPKTFCAVALVLLGGPLAAADAMDTAAPYTYHGDWELVSAPPPSGPYHAVNLDPRVPGQGSMPPISSGYNRMQDAPGGSSSAAVAPPVAEEEPRGAPGPGYPVQEPYGYGPPPGAYVPRRYDRGAVPAYGYPQPSRYPAQRPGFRTNRYMAPPGAYYTPQVRGMGQDIPPPPASYEGAMENPQTYSKPDHPGAASGAQ